MFNRLHSISAENAGFSPAGLRLCVCLVSRRRQLGLCRRPSPRLGQAARKRRRKFSRIARSRWSQLHPRTEAEQDHLDAAALFATGRTLESRQEFAAALRRSGPGRPARSTIDRRPARSGAAGLQS